MGIIEMKLVSLTCLIVGTLNCLVQEAYGEYVTLTNDGPCVKGGRIVFRADIFDYGDRRPSGGTYSFKFKDNGLYPHEFETQSTTNTTSYYEVDYPVDKFPVGLYTMEVIVEKKYLFIWEPITSGRTSFEITNLMNGNMSAIQHNSTLPSSFVSSNADTKFSVNLRNGDEYYVKTNSSDISTFWFVDCKYYGMSQDFSFDYKFPKPGVNHTIEALVIVSHDPPVTTTVAPTTTTTQSTTTTTTTTTLRPPPANSSNVNATNATVNNSTKPIAVPLVVSSSTPDAITTTPTPKTTATVTNSTTSLANATIAKSTVNETVLQLGNLTFPFVCLNNSVIPPNPKKTYGYFHRDVIVKAPITNITVEGTNWIQPWQTLELNVTCPGSGPFKRCLRVLQGQYNVTGNETCDNPVELRTCNFTIRHYFLESGVSTVLVMLSNDVSNHVYPLTITVYKAIKKPQLSVIVVPVSCSLAAVVCIIFGVAYYIQSRARFTVEVADFDFGQTNPEMEYKTFTERLRDSFNNSVRPAGYRINTVRRSYYGSMNDQRIPITNSKGYKQLNPENAQWGEGCEQVRGIDQ